MSGVVGPTQVILRARAQMPVLEAERAALRKAHAEHQADVTTLEGEVEAAWRYLASVLIPELTPAVCDAAARRLAFPNISWASLDAGRVAEQRRLNDELAAVDAAPVYQRREAILNECDIHLAELADALAPLRHSLDRFAGQPRWDVLLARGYGKEGYLGKWWSLSYYQDWKHADLAVEALGPVTGATTFAELMSVYEAEKQAYDELARAHAGFVARRDEVNALVARRQDALDRLAHLTPRLLARAQGQLIEHLRPLAGEEITTRLATDETCALAYKRVLGVEAKIAYLKQLHDEWVAKPLRQVERAFEKNRRDLIKLSRPKNHHLRFDVADLERRFADRSTSWNKRWNNYDESRRSILVFHDYHLYDPYGDMLWWSLMTHDHCKPRFIPEVARHYERRHGTHDDAVVAVAAGEDGHFDTTGDYS